jgi:uncharacterized membrane protein
MPSAGQADSIVKFLKTDDGQRLAIVAFSILASAVLWTLPGGALAYVFGLPLLFFVPGFAVVRLFFWKGTSPEAKFVLSLGLSILVLIFLGLILVLTPIGLAPDTTRASVLVFAIGAVAFDILWKRPEPKEAKKPAAPEPEKAPRTIKLDKVVASMIGTAIVISAISLGLILTADYPSRTYFALTDDTGSANINTTRDHNSVLNLTLHMKNGEEGPRTFRIVAHNETIFYSQEFNKTLQKGELWEQNVSIDLVYWGQFKIDFDLYIQKQGSPEYFYGNLHLWIEVV